MPSLKADLFESVPCPGCDSGRQRVIRPSRYPASVTAEELKRLYSASSDHILLDQVVQCEECSLVFVNPRPASRLVLAGYTEAEDPLFAEQNSGRIRTFHKTLLRFVKRAGINPKGKRVLDVGCAGGAFLVAARDCGFEAVGVEPSRWMAAHGRRMYNVDIRDGVLEAGMFPEASFDVITLWDVIEHLPNPQQTLALIRVLLKPDGYLLVNFPDIGSIAARMLGDRWPFWLSVHLLYYTRKTMAQQLERAGFSTLWYEPCWQTLPLGYVAQRAVPYARFLAPLPHVLKWLHLSSAPFTYNMGQTLAVAKQRNLS